MLACSPCMILIVANLPCLSRQSPLSEVPIQSVPSASAWSASTKSLPSPSCFLNCFNAPSFRQPSPPPNMPNQTVPSGDSTIARTSGKANCSFPANQVSLPASKRCKPTVVPIHTSPFFPSYKATTGAVIRLNSPGDSNRSPTLTISPPPHVPTKSSCRRVSNTDHTKRLARPLVSVKLVQRSPWKWYKPAPSVPIQASPSGLTTNDNAARPCHASGGLSILTFRGRNTSRPPPVPIQIFPSWSSQIDRTQSWERPLVREKCAGSPPGVSK